MRDKSTFREFSFRRLLKPEKIEEYPGKIGFPLTMLRSSANSSVEAEAKMRFFNTIGNANKN